MLLLKKAAANFFYMKTLRNFLIFAGMVMTVSLSCAASDSITAGDGVRAGDVSGRDAGIRWWGPAENVAVLRCNLNLGNVVGAMPSWGGTSGYTPSVLEERIAIGVHNKDAYGNPAVAVIYQGPNVGWTLNLEGPSAAPALYGLTRYELWVEKQVSAGAVAWWPDKRITVDCTGTLACTFNVASQDQSNDKRALIGTIISVLATENPDLVNRYFPGEWSVGGAGAVASPFQEGVNLTQIGWVSQPAGSNDTATDILNPYKWWRFSDVSVEPRGSTMPTSVGVKDEVVGKLFQYAPGTGGHNTPATSNCTISVGAELLAGALARKWTIDSPSETAGEFVKTQRKVVAERFDQVVNAEVVQKALQVASSSLIDEGLTLEKTNSSVGAIIDSRTVGIYRLGNFRAFTSNPLDGSGSGTDLPPKGEIYAGEVIPDMDVCFGGTDVYPQCILACVIEQQVPNDPTWRVAYFQTFDTATNLRSDCGFGDKNNFYPINETAADASDKESRPTLYPRTLYNWFFRFNLKAVAVQDANYRVKFYVRVPYKQPALEAAATLCLASSVIRYGCPNKPEIFDSLQFKRLVRSAYTGTVDGIAAADDKTLSLAPDGTTWIWLNDPNLECYFTVKTAQLHVGPSSAPQPGEAGQSGATNPAATIVTDQ